MSEPALFTGLLVSRPSKHGRRLRRLGGLTIAALLHSATAAILVLAPLLLVERVDPQASVTAIGFLRPRQPGLTGDGRSASAIRQGEGGPGAAAPSPNAGTPRPPVRESQPSIVPLPPPTAEDDSPAEVSPTRLQGPGDGTGTGDPLGRGNARWGTPDGCRDCPETVDGPGPEGPGGPILSPNHPSITTQPALIETTRRLPRYPEAARRARVQGVVILLIVIRADGTVGRIEALRAPDPRFGFDLAAIEAVKEWRYRPALMQGRPVAIEAIVQVDFMLVR